MRVICVKWGNKYSAEYVNKLYGMVSRHAPESFEFICLTEDSKGINHNIKTIPFPANNDYELWWNKMYMFDMFNDGTKNLYFDLDVVIHDSLDFFWQHEPKLPTVIKSRWNEHAFRKFEKNDTLINSSVVLWYDTSHIWNKFKTDQEKYMSIYKGIDRFIWNENIEFDVFPPGHIYSYWKGVDSNDREQQKYREGYSVCILNHKPKPHEMKDSWIQNYWVE